MIFKEMQNTHKMVSLYFAVLFCMYILFVVTISFYILSGKELNLDFQISTVYWMLLYNEEKQINYKINKAKGAWRQSNNKQSITE